MAFDHSIIGKEFGPFDFEYDWKQVSLYNLACGAGTEDLPFVVETNDGPQVLPSFSVVVAYEALMAALVKLGGNMATLVHGSQKCVFHQAIGPSGKLSTTSKITGLYDKGKGALAIYETVTKNQAGETIFETEWQIFYRGEGGFGGERGPESPKFAPEEGAAPSSEITQNTSDTQALIYRLASGDLNPIHSDPGLATKVGFPKPILHGLCTFGHACLAAVNAVADGDVSKVKSFEGRFTKPVLPGDTLVTKIWSGDGDALYETSVKERNEKVITLGRVTLK